MSKRKHENNSNNSNNNNYDVDMTNDSDDEIEYMGTNITNIEDRPNTFLNNYNIPLDIFLQNNQSQQNNFLNYFHNASSDFEKFKIVIKRIDEVKYLIEQGVPNYFNGLNKTWENKISSIRGGDELRQNQEREFFQLEMEVHNKKRHETLEQLEKTLSDLENLKTELYRKREVIAALRDPVNKNLSRFGRKKRNLSSKQMVSFLNQYVYFGNTREKGINKLAKYFSTSQ